MQCFLFVLSDIFIFIKYNYILKKNVIKLCLHANPNEHLDYKLSNIMVSHKFECGIKLETKQNYYAFCNNGLNVDTHSELSMFLSWVPLNNALCLSQSSLLFLCSLFISYK